MFCRPSNRLDLAFSVKAVPSLLHESDGCSNLQWIFNNQDNFAEE